MYFESEINNLSWEVEKLKKTMFELDISFNYLVDFFLKFMHAVTITLKIF